MVTGLGSSSAAPFPGCANTNYCGYYHCPASVPGYLARDVMYGPIHDTGHYMTADRRSPMRYPGPPAPYWLEIPVSFRAHSLPSCRRRPRPKQLVKSTTTPSPPGNPGTLVWQLGDHIRTCQLGAAEREGKKKKRLLNPAPAMWEEHGRPGCQ